MITIAHVYYIVRLLRLENERLMRRGHPHMNVDEMRFIVSGILGHKGRELFDEEVERIEKGIGLPSGIPDAADNQ